MNDSEVRPTDAVSSHYSRDDLLSRLNAALIADAVDPENPILEALAADDQFSVNRVSQGTRSSN